MEKLFLLFRITSFDSTYKYLKYGEGLLATAPPTGMFLQTKYVKDEDDWPDVQFIYLPRLLSAKGANYKEKFNFDDKFWNSYYVPIMGKHGYTALLALLRPKSRFAIYLYITNAMISVFLLVFCPYSELLDKIFLRTRKCRSELSHEIHTRRVRIKN